MLINLLIQTKFYSIHPNLPQHNLKLIANLHCIFLILTFPGKTVKNTIIYAKSQNVTQEFRPDNSVKFSTHNKLQCFCLFFCAWQIFELQFLLIDYFNRKMERNDALDFYHCTRFRETSPKKRNRKNRYMLMLLCRLSLSFAPWRRMIHENGENQRGETRLGNQISFKRLSVYIKPTLFWTNAVSFRRENEWLIQTFKLFRNSFSRAAFLGRFFVAVFALVSFEILVSWGLGNSSTCFSLHCFVWEE